MLSKEGCHARGLVDVIIGSEFSIRYPIYPIILSIVDKASEEVLKQFVGNLGLPVSLRVVGCRELYLDTITLAITPPEPAHKSSPSVRDNGS